MASTVQIRNLILGEGRPKICIPLTDTTKETLVSAAQNIIHPELHCDLAEWRADFFKHLPTPGSAFSGSAASGSETSDGAFHTSEFFDTLSGLRRTLGDTPLLFTIRTDAEGGAVTIDTASYLHINQAAIQSGCIDLVDVELSRGEEAVQTVVRAAHQAGVAVIGSRHDFSKTPPREEIIASLCRMQTLGCDIAKYAVMPQTERDVLTLLDATLIMKEQHTKTPVITMSMGNTGVISRISGGLFGSCLTFGTAGAASAPGQLPSELLFHFLETLSLSVTSA